jgi:F420-dependent oxidoreductase-like protein
MAMKIGLNIGLDAGSTLERQIEAVTEAEKAGFDSFWAGHGVANDVLTMLAMAGTRTSRITLGTAVIPLRQPRGPVALAQQALTVQAATQGRLVLGIGSPPPVSLPIWRVSDVSPVLFMREYVTILNGLLQTGSVDFHGKVFDATASLSVPESGPCPVMLGALGPAMLRLAGELADGTITWLTGPKTVETYIAPTISQAAQEAGRPTPTVCVSVPVAVTNDMAAGKEAATQYFERYGNAPHYQRLMEIEGVSKPADLAIMGNQSEVERQIQSMADAGATVFEGFVFPVGSDAAASRKETLGVLSALAKRV